MRMTPILYSSQLIDEVEDLHLRRPSRAVVGSSAMRMRGLHTRAMAIATLTHALELERVNG